MAQKQSPDLEAPALDQPPTPSPELKRLDVLVGKWHSEGQTKASPSIKINGTDTYEWLSGGFFLVHHVDVRMGDEQVKVIEIVGGYDAASHTYPMRSFDSHGNFVTMQASVSDDGVWTFAGEWERATLVIGDDGNSMSAHWERLDDRSNWIPWMDMKFARVE
jgi:hypothetical protein